MNDYIEDFRRTVIRAAELLRLLPEKRAGQKSGPDRWSPKEIIGHLIDSAANNHQRFVRGQFQGELVFPGYRQNEWVKAQQYSSQSWLALVELWKYYNLHLAHVMEVMPLSLRFHQFRRHNFHEIAWQPVRHDQPATLDDFMRDYIGHLKHHLRQIIPDAEF